MRLRDVSSGRELEVELISMEGAAICVRLHGHETRLGFQPLADGSAILTIDGRRIRVAAARHKGSILAAAGPAAFELAPVAQGRRAAVHGLVTPEVTAPMPGKVLKVLVSEHERVEAGQPLVVLEAMKMETTLSAESAAIVKRVAVAAGQAVDHGAVLLELSPLSGQAPPEPDLQES